LAELVEALFLLASARKKESPSTSSGKSGFWVGAVNPPRFLPMLLTLLAVLAVIAYLWGWI
jgi:hypothetical protein